MTVEEFQKWLPPLLVIGGWTIAYQLQAMQARRKMLREEVDKARQAVEKLQETALRFHMNVYSIQDRMQIMGAITDIERRCSMFPKIGSARRAWLPHAVSPKLTSIDMKCLVVLRQVITMQHFDDPTAAALLYNDPQLIEISGAATQMITEIDRVLVAALD